MYSYPYPPGYYQQAPYPPNSYVPCVFCHSTIQANAMRSHLAQCPSARAAMPPTVMQTPFGSTQSVQYRRVVRVEKRTVDQQNVRSVPVNERVQPVQVDPPLLSFDNPGFKGSGRLIANAVGKVGCFDVVGSEWVLPASTATRSRSAVVRVAVVAVVAIASKGECSDLAATTAWSCSAVCSAFRICSVRAAVVRVSAIEICSTICETSTTTTSSTPAAIETSSAAHETSVTAALKISSTPTITTHSAIESCSTSATVETRSTTTICPATAIKSSATAIEISATAALKTCPATAASETATTLTTFSTASTALKTNSTPAIHETSTAIKAITTASTCSARALLRRSGGAEPRLAV